MVTYGGHHPSLFGSKTQAGGWCSKVQSLYGCGDQYGCGDHDDHGVRGGRDDRGVRVVEEDMLRELLASSTDRNLCRSRIAGHRSQLVSKLTDSTPASCFACKNGDASETMYEGAQKHLLAVPSRKCQHTRKPRKVQSN